MGIETAEQHEALIDALMDPVRWPAGGADRRRIDTHISTIVLAGSQAYKIKKPLDLGFLDFRSLDARHAACEEELRLNRPQAPQVYRAVCPVTGSVAAPAIDGAGPVIDWAVCMHRFDPDAILSNHVDRLQPRLIERLAGRVAALHARAPRCPDDAPYGMPAQVVAPMQANFRGLRAQERGPADPIVERLQAWTAAQAARLHDRLEQRRADGRVRECHGDLHLGNVALIDGEPVIFDALEFDPDLRWIDTASDLAFLTMDLHHRGRADLAHRFLDHYLEIAGDYDGLAVHAFYQVYRALVRAKIAAIRAAQPLPPPQGRAVAAERAAYLRLAEGLAAPRRGALVIGHGVSGSGKSFVSAQLPGPLPAVRLRSDVERKRLLGIDASSDARAHGAYTPAMTQRTYARLLALARTVVATGYVAVVDATFLLRAQRTAFRALADELQVPFLILDCDAPRAALRARIAARAGETGNVSDADLAVLDAQLRTREPLRPDEARASVVLRPDRPLRIDALRRRLTGPPEPPGQSA